MDHSFHSWIFQRFLFFQCKGLLPFDALQYCFDFLQFLVDFVQSHYCEILFHQFVFIYSSINFSFYQSIFSFRIDFFNFSVSLFLALIPAMYASTLPQSSSFKARISLQSCLCNIVASFCLVGSLI